MPGDDASSNGRVTLALVQQDIRSLSMRLDELSVLLRLTIEQGERRLLVAETQQARHDERINAAKEDIATLARRSNFGDVMTASAAAVAALLGLTR